MLRQHQAGDRIKKQELSSALGVGKHRLRRIIYRRQDLREQQWIVDKNLRVHRDRSSPCGSHDHHQTANSRRGEDMKECCTWAKMATFVHIYMYVYIHICIYMYICSRIKRVRFSRAVDYGIMSWDYIMGLHYGIILRGCSTFLVFA